MIRLLRTELTRLRWRRAAIILVGACFVLTALLAATTTWNTRPVSTAENQQAQERAKQDPGFQQMVKECQSHPRRYGAGTAADCEASMVQGYGTFRPELRLHGEITNGGPSVATIVLMLLVLTGATFAGADWSSGSMSNQLLFEPRRLRVWLSKAATIGLVAAAVALVAMLAWWLVMVGVAQHRGLPVTQHVKTEIAWQIARCTFLAALGAMGGYALTMLSRSTVFTLGTLFALSVASTVLIMTLPGITHRQRWIIPTNLSAVMQGVSRFYEEPPPSCQNGGPRALCSGMQVVTVWQGLAYLAVPFAVVVLLSLWSFRRRDVP